MRISVSEMVGLRAEAEDRYFDRIEAEKRHSYKEGYEKGKEDTDIPVNTGPRYRRLYKKALDSNEALRGRLNKVESELHEIKERLHREKMEERMKELSDYILVWEFYEDPDHVYVGSYVDWLKENGWHTEEDIVMMDPDVLYEEVFCHGTPDVHRKIGKFLDVPNLLVEALIEDVGAMKKNRVI